MAPRNLGEAYKSAEGDTLMKSSETFGVRHVMKIGGAEPQVKPSAGLAKLIDDLSKSSSSNAEHLGHTAMHLDKLGTHLRAAKESHPDNEDLDSAIQHHRMATS
jgi:hypothetical protein